MKSDPLRIARKILHALEIELGVPVGSLENNKRLAEIVTETAEAEISAIYYSNHAETISLTPPLFS